MSITSFSADLTAGPFVVPKNRQAEFLAHPRPASSDETGADIVIDGVVAGRIQRLAIAAVGPLYAGPGSIIEIDGNSPVSINGRLSDV